MTTVPATAKCETVSAEKEQTLGLWGNNPKDNKEGTVSISCEKWLGAQQLL